VAVFINTGEVPYSVVATDLLAMIVEVSNETGLDRLRMCVNADFDRGCSKPLSAFGSDPGVKRAERDNDFAESPRRHFLFRKTHNADGH
jgi:hypothetical protein